jgi:hypothetical protein
VEVHVTRVPRENHWPVASQQQTASHNVVSSTPRLINNISVFYSIISLVVLISLTQSFLTVVFSTQ